MLRSITTVSTGTLGSRLLGYVRDALLAALLGAGAVADAFLVAFQLINIIRRLSTEGALNAALVPAFLRVRNSSGEEAASAYAGRIFGTLALIILCAAGLMYLLMPPLIGVLAPGFAPEALARAVGDARLMLPYLVFAGPAAVLIGVLNARGRVALAAFAPMLFNFLLVAVMVALLVSRAFDAATVAIILAATIAFAGFLQFVIIAMAGGNGARAWPVRVRLDRPMRQFLDRAWTGMAASAGPQLMMIIGAMLASATPSAVAWLYFASRLIELPLGLASMNIGAVLLPAVTRAVQNGDTSGLSAVQSRALELALGLALPASLALVALAAPIVRLLFEHGAFVARDSAGTAAALMVFALALPGHVLNRALAAPFFAHNDTRTPLVTMLIGLSVAFGAGVTLRATWGHLGIAAALTFATWLQAALLAARAPRGTLTLDRPARRNLPRILLASLIMAGAVAGVSHAFAALPASRLGEAFLLGLIILGGLGLYALLLMLFGVIDRARLRQAWQRRDPV